MIVGRSAAAGPASLIREAQLILGGSRVLCCMPSRCDAGRVSFEFAKLPGLWEMWRDDGGYAGMRLDRGGWYGAVGAHDMTSLLASGVQPISMPIESFINRGVVSSTMLRVSLSAITQSLGPSSNGAFA
jgi:hypothetical protein